MRRVLFCLLYLCLTSVYALVPLSARGTNWKVTKTLHLGGEGGWDYVTVDPHSHRLFITRTTHTMVVDALSGKMLGDIPGQLNAHGVAIVSSLKRGFITDGGGKGSIIVFDLQTFAILGHIPAMPDADGIIYDAKLNKVLAVSGDSGVLMTFRPDIDPAHGKMDANIELGGAPEYLASDGMGKVYVNLEDKDTLAVVDLTSRKVVARWPVTPGGHPVGLALDTGTHQLFIGCRNPQKLVVMSTQNGAVTSSMPIGAGVDATLFDEGRAFASCRDGSLVVAANKAGSWKVGQIVKTPLGARTMGVDPETHHIYLPTAEMEVTTNGKSRPKAGTFMIIEVGLQ